MRKNIFWFLICFLIGMIGGIFADQIFWPYFVERPLFYEYGLERPPVYVTEKREVRIQENIALQEAIERVEKVVVAVGSNGSGLIVTSDGLIVTLADLVPAGPKASVFVEGQGLAFKVLKIKDGLALLKIEPKEPLSARPFADLEQKKLGERVFVLGKVLTENDLEKRANEGIIRNLDPDYIRTNIFEESILRGSPLFDIEGNVLGINALDSKSRITAIPNTKIKEFVGF